MKYLNFCLGFLLCLFSFSLFAQTPKKIEDDLLKSFNKIDQWYQKENDTTSNMAAASDSLFAADDVFARKLENYAKKFPSTIAYPFNSLKKGIDISTSPDGLFRIYSWDAETGGTEHYFENVIQYKTGEIVNAVIDKPDGEAISNYNYNKVYFLRANNNAYYLARYLMIG